MNERLVELLMHTEAYTAAEEEYARKQAKYKANYLLANGVIVPPCNVGDKVYRISGNLRGEKIYKGAVDQIVVRDDNRVVFYVYGHPLHFTEYDIGKTVFLSREEAEAKLREVTQNG